jgi:hypothetical protein
MAKGSPTKGKVIEFSSVRKRAGVADEVRAVVNDTPAPRGGFLDGWLKNHEDGQALLKENQRLRALQEDLQVSAQEYGLYVGSLLAYIGIMVVWALQLT